MNCLDQWEWPQAHNKTHWADILVLQILGIEVIIAVVVVAGIVVGIGNAAVVVVAGTDDTDSTAVDKVGVAVVGVAVVDDGVVRID